MFSGDIAEVSSISNSVQLVNLFFNKAFITIVHQIYIDDLGTE